MGWQDAPVVDEGPGGEPPVKIGPRTDPKMAQTMRDIEAGKPAPPLTWNGGPLPAGVGREAPTAPKAKWESAPVVADDTSTLSPDKPITPSLTSGFVGGVKNLAAFADMALSLPAMALGVGVDLGTRLEKAVLGKDRRDSAKLALERSAEYSDPFSNPIDKVMRLFGYKDSYSDSDVSKALHTVTSWIEKGGDWIEKNTKGVLLKEDVQSIANTLMVAAPVGGLPPLRSFMSKVRDTIPAGEIKAGRLSDPTIEKLLDRYTRETGNKEGLTTSTMKERVEEMLKRGPPAENVEARGVPPEAVEGAAKRYGEELAGKSDADIRAETQAYELMARGASLAEVARARKTNPLVGKKLDALMARRQELRSGEMARGVLQGEVLPPEPPAGPTGIPGPAPTGPRPTGPALQRSSSSTDIVPKLAAAGAVTAGALWAQQNPDKVDDAAALAVGAILATKGKEGGWNLPERAMGTLMKDMRYTLKTFERLPQNRTEFPKQMVLDQLKRPDVVGPEKALVENILRRAPGDKVTAQELVDGFNLETGNHDLRMVPSDKYATYGLHRIGRSSDPYISPERMADPAVRDTRYGKAVTMQYLSPFELGATKHFGVSELFGWVRSFKDLDNVKHVVEIQSDFAQGLEKKLRELTPDKINSYRGVQKRYTEDIKRWEPFIKDPTDPGALRSIIEHNSYQVWNLFKDMAPNFAGEFNRTFEPGWPAEAARYIERHPEIRDTLQESMKERMEHTQETLKYIDAQLKSVDLAPKMEPMVKFWERRLIREALAERALAGENVRETLEIAKRDGAHPDSIRGLERLLDATKKVRFATADTVAKVEGWPKEFRLPPDEVYFPEIRGMNFAHTTDEHWTFTGRTSTEGDFEIREARGPTEFVEQGELPKEVGKVLREKYGESFKPEHQGIYDRYAKGVHKFLKSLGGQEVTDAGGNTWIEVPTQGRGRVEQYGRIDPELLKTVAVAGVGAVLGATLASDQKTLAAIMGAGLAVAGMKNLGAVIKGADKVAGVLSTRMRNISQGLADHAVDYERRVLQGTHERLMAVDPFLRKSVTLPAAMQEALALALFNRDRQGVANILRAVGDPQFVRDTLQMQQVIGDLGKELVARGRLSAMLQDYFPRIVSDYEGLLNHLGGTQKTQLETLIRKARDKAAQAGTVLTKEEESRLINGYLQSTPAGARPGFLKGRTIGNITPDLLQFYSPPLESLHSYILGAVKDLEKARFFGRHLQTKNGVFLLDESIGSLVGEELNAGRITPKQVDELRSLLVSRFKPGERAGDPRLQAIKDIAYMGLLGNVKATLTQVGDVPVSLALHGFKPTLTALAHQLTGRAAVHPRDFGLVDHIAEEFVGTGGTQKALNKLYRATLFSGMDLFAKGTALEASLVKHQAALRTPAGQVAFAARWGEFFSPPELAQVMADFQAGRVSDGVQSVLWSDLSKAQPVSRMELPQAYLDHPNGRMLYMLKTFTIKQLDLIRNEGYAKIKSGNVREGLGFMARYAAIMTVAGVGIGAVKAWLEGKPFDLEAPTMDNLMKSFGWSQYAMDTARRGKPLEAAAGVIAPPYKMFDDIIRRDPKALRYIPFVGPLVESHFGGGKERAEKAAKAKERKAAREAAKGNAQ